MGTSHNSRLLPGRSNSQISHLFWGKWDTNTSAYLSPGNMNLRYLVSLVFEART